MTGLDDSKNFYLTTGKNIKKYRDLRNYSLQVLAEKVGVTKKTIQRYENGDIRIDMERLKEVANALDVPVKKLTEGTGVFTVNEESSAYSTNAELSEKMELLGQVERLAEKYQLDLSDPASMQLLEEAFNFVKRIQKK